MTNRRVLGVMSLCTIVGLIGIQACSSSDAPATDQTADSGAKKKAIKGTDDSPSETSKKDSSGDDDDDTADSGPVCPEAIGEDDINYLPAGAKSTACTSKVLNAVVAALLDDTAGYSAVKAAAMAGEYPSTGADGGAGATNECMACLFADYQTTTTFAPIMIYGDDTQFFVNYSNCYAHAKGGTAACAEILEKQDDCASAACASCATDDEFESCVDKENADENGICATLIGAQVETKCADYESILEQCRADDLTDASNNSLAASEYRKVIGTACGGL